MRHTALALVLLLGACSSQAVLQGNPADQERMRYEAALNDLIRSRTQEAQEAFATLMESSSNPEVTELSMLRLGDALFAEGKFAEAREVYRQFTEQFGSSPNVPHALYMSARCHLERTPSDLWILPPAAEREQGDLKQALTLLRRLILSHRESFSAVRGRALYARSAKKSCEHELYVAEYYVGRKRPVGAIQRLEQLLADEADQRKQGLLPPSWHMCRELDSGFLLLAEAYTKDGSRAGVESTLGRYLALRPNGEAAKDMRELLKDLK
ncbi:MAG: outer membrane protein assembly factor BamD [Pseudomonadota bacterium]